MLKHYAVLEMKEGEHEVKILISGNCPLGFAHDSLFKGYSYILERMNEAAKQNDPKKPEEVKEA